MTKVKSDPGMIAMVIRTTRMRRSRTSHSGDGDETSHESPLQRPGMRSRFLAKTGYAASSAPRIPGKRVNATSGPKTTAV